MPTWNRTRFSGSDRLVNRMSEPIRFYSTNRNVPRVNLAEALLQGQAGDRGLFMPETYPPLTTDDLKRLVGKPYPQVAHGVLRRYTTGIIDDAASMALCVRS